MLAPAVGEGHLAVAITTCQEVVGCGSLGHQAKRAGVQVLALGSRVGVLIFSLRNEKNKNKPLLSQMKEHG